MNSDANNDFRPVSLSIVPEDPEAMETDDESDHWSDGDDDHFATTGGAGPSTTGGGAVAGTVLPSAAAAASAPEGEWQLVTPDDGAHPYYWNSATGATSWENPVPTMASAAAAAGDVADETLPEGWQRVAGAQGAASYFWNERTGETSWVIPQSSSSSSSGGGGASKRCSLVPSAAFGTRAGRDRDDSEISARESAASDRPTEFDREESDEEEELSTSALADASGWEEEEDASGRRYFFHSHTGETSWTQPANFAAAVADSEAHAASRGMRTASTVMDGAHTGFEAEAEEWKLVEGTGGDGRSYYWNEHTQETSWEKPKCVQLASMAASIGSMAAMVAETRRATLQAKQAATAAATLAATEAAPVPAPTPMPLAKKTAAPPLTADALGTSNLDTATASAAASAAKPHKPGVPQQRPSVLPATAKQTSNGRASMTAREEAAAKAEAERIGALRVVQAADNPFAKKNYYDDGQPPEPPSRANRTPSGLGTMLNVLELVDGGGGGSGGGSSGGDGDGGGDGGGAGHASKTSWTNEGGFVTKMGALVKSGTLGGMSRFMRRWYVRQSPQRQLRRTLCSPECRCHSTNQHLTFAVLFPPSPSLRLTSSPQVCA